MISRLRSLFKGSSDNSLNRHEAEVLRMLRATPRTQLSGDDLACANRMSSRGLLKGAGVRQFVITEKGLAALRGPKS